MNIIRALEIGFGVIAIVFVLTQMVLPALRGRPLWPFFRVRKTVEQLAAEKSRTDERHLNEEIKREKRK